MNAGPGEPLPRRRRPRHDIITATEADTSTLSQVIADAFGDLPQSQWLIPDPDARREIVILEVSSKLGRHFWRNPPVSLDAGQWERLPGRLGIDPARHAEAAGILAEVRRVVDSELTSHQRRLFVAIVVDGIPLDALAAELGLRRNAIYKVIFDARRKIRRALVANGYLEEPGVER